MKKADIGVALYLLAGGYFFHCSNQFHLVGCDDRDQYFYRVNYTV